MKRIVSLLLAAALGASLLAAPASAAAADKGVTYWRDSIGNNAAKLVSVDMKPGRTGEISLANNSVVESASVKTLVDQKNSQANTHVVAAINGGFFNSYTSKPWSYPGKCPTIMDAVVSNGKLIHTGRSSTLGFTADGKAMVDWVDFGNEVRLGNGTTVGSGWGINTYQSDPNAIMLFNEHLTLPVNIPASSSMVFIQDKKVTKITAGGTLTVPKGTDVLVYNSAAAAQYKEWGMFPTVGMSAKNVLTAKGTSRDVAWGGVQSALTGGPVLVKDGMSVVRDERNNVFYNDPKQQPDRVAARSFVGVTWSGSLVLGTVNASFAQIADWMVAQNLKEGIAMDGGGSCMLYAEGSGYLSQGRDLAAALVIVDRTGAGGLPAESNMAPANLDVADGWAVNDIQTAISLGLVPDNLQKGYQDDITRQDFCLLIEKLARKDPDFITKLYAVPEVSGFTDTNRDELRWCAQMGVVSGYPDGSFRPYNTLTREEAAKILALTTQFLGAKKTTEQYPFTDRDPNGWAWSQGYIDFCGTNQIMNGVGGGKFGPKGSFTRQQAIVTMLRIYNRYLA